MRRGGFNQSDVKEVFRIYNWQKTDLEQDPQVLDRLEELLRVKGVRWPGPKTRASLLRQKIFAILDAVMKRLGWVQGYGSRDAQTGKMTMTYAPADPKRPKTSGLPDWLPLDFLVLDTKDQIVWILQRIRLEHQSKGAENPRVASGSGLFQRLDDLDHQGTIGAIVEDKLTAQQFVLTAGHVIPDDETTMVAKSAGEVTSIDLEVPMWAMRKNGRPIQRHGLPESGDDETSGILRVDNQDADKIDAKLQSVNCHHFNLFSDEAEIPPDPLQPLAMGPRLPDIQEHLVQHGIVVEKVGQSTDCTSGKLVRVGVMPPPGSYGRADE
jgi:hypothetical protein